MQSSHRRRSRQSSRSPLPEPQSLDIVAKSLWEIPLLKSILNRNWYSQIGANTDDTTVAECVKLSVSNQTTASKQTVSSIGENWVQIDKPTVGFAPPELPDLGLLRSQAKLCATQSKGFWKTKVDQAVAEIVIQPARTKQATPMAFASKRWIIPLLRRLPKIECRIIERILGTVTHGQVYFLHSRRIHVFISYSAFRLLSRIGGRSCPRQVSFHFLPWSI